MECDSCRTHFVIPAAPTLSSRPQWRDLNQLAAVSVTCWGLRGWVRCGGRSFGFAQDDRVWSVIPAVLTLSSRPHPICHPGRTQSVIPTAKSCHPDRSGGITTSWLRAFRYTKNHRRHFPADNKKGHLFRSSLIYFSGGPDGTRTRDLRRDRPAF